MPKLDTIHIAVKNALTKAGWVITHDPYKIVYEEMTLYADLAAEHPIAAERQGRKIVVEIKSFLGPTWVQELKTAVGQYDIYRTFLEVVAQSVTCTSPSTIGFTRSFSRRRPFS